MSENKYKDNNKTWIQHPDKCTSCGLCVQMCPVNALSPDGEGSSKSEQNTVKCQIEKCIVCGICEGICPTGTILVES